MSPVPGYGTGSAVGAAKPVQCFLKGLGASGGQRGRS